ncbi:MAG: PaaI family thioesterase [Alphaproteobacteria bacterium]
MDAPASTAFGAIPAEQFANRPGIDILTDMLAGTVPQPPVAKFLGFRLIEVSLGRAAFEGVPPADFVNPFGNIAGGYHATILDAALGCAILSQLKPGTSMTTVEFKVTCLRPLTADMGVVRAEATALHAGRRLGAAEARLIDTEGRLMAHGTTTCLIFPVEGTSK